MMHYDERDLGSLTQLEQALAQRRHGARIVLILIVRRVQRIEDNDLGGGRSRSVEEVIQSLRGTEQMAGGACIDQQILVGG